MKILKVIPQNEVEAGVPVLYVCYHPICASKLERGITTMGLTGEKIKPYCCAVDYDYDTSLAELCEALGWQGGSWDMAVKEVKRLRLKEKTNAL